MSGRPSEVRQYLHFNESRVIRQLGTEGEVTVNGKVHNVPGANSNGES